MGSSKCFQVRWFQHHKSLAQNKHQNKFLQSDFNKCRELLGNDDFLEFHILEVMPDSSKEQRLLAEERWIQVHFDKGQQCYNLCSRAISREGNLSKDPRETARKCSETQKRLWSEPIERQKRIEGKDGQRRKNMGLASKQVWEELSEAAKQKKISNLLSVRGWPKGSKHKEDSKQSMRKTRKEKYPFDSPEYQRLVDFGLRNAKTAKLVDPNGVIHEITNISAFCRKMGFRKQSVLELTNGKRDNYKGWKMLS